MRTNTTKHRYPLFLAIVLGVFLAGCGDTTREAQEDNLLAEGSGSTEAGGVAMADDTPTAPSLVDDGPLMEEADGSEAVTACSDNPPFHVVIRQVYYDHDESDRSPYTEGFNEGDEWANGDLEVLGALPDSFKQYDCGDGRIAFVGLTEGPYLIRPKLGPDTRCTTANCSSRFANAISERRVPSVVTAGDSICVVGTQPLFPDRLKALFSGLTEINVINVCKAGSTSPQWLPGTPYFRQSLAPHIPNADLLVVSLGGNDVLQFVGNIIQTVGVPSDIEGTLGMAKDLVRDIVGNLRKMIVDVRTLNPTVDIVYLLYMDYSRAENHRLWGVVGGFLGVDAVGEVLEVARDAFPTDIPNLMLVDLFGRSKDIDVIDYLYDELHMNDLGHTLYAEELFETLGGVRRGDVIIGGEGRAVLGQKTRFGLAPIRQ